MSAADLLDYARELEALGETDRALAEYTEFIDAYLGGVEPLIRRADVLRRLGRTAEAHADMREVPLRRAAELEAQGRVEDALVEYAALADAQIGGVDPLMRRSDLLERINRTREAEIDLHRAARIAGNGGLPMMRLAQIASATGRPWLAATHIKSAIEAAPDQAASRIAAATIFLTLDWVDRAFAAVRSLPSDGDAIVQRAADAYWLHHEQARARLRRFGENPDTVLDMWELSLALFRVGRIEAARSLCQRVMRDRPHSFAAFGFYAKIIARQRGVAAAAAFLAEIEPLHAGDPEYTDLRALMDRQLEAA